MTSRRHLDESLQKLRAEIRALDSGDEEARQRLDRLVRDIETRIDDSNGATGDDSLAGGLKAAILKFEVSHPRVAVLMNDVLEKLSAMGI
jgi:Domain of unknown function (DUF4404)